MPNEEYSTAGLLCNRGTCLSIVLMIWGLQSHSVFLNSQSTYSCSVPLKRKWGHYHIIETRISPTSALSSLGFSCWSASRTQDPCTGVVSVCMCKCAGRYVGPPLYVSMHVGMQQHLDLLHPFITYLNKKIKQSKAIQTKNKKLITTTTTNNNNNNKLTTWRLWSGDSGDTEE